MANYKDLHGFQIKHRSSDPANPIAGEIWYNTTSQTLKVAPKIGAWASSGDLGTARYNLVGCGTLTAGLVFAGRAPATGVTEEYDGSSWTESGDCNTARQQAAGFGTQTAALGTGGYVDGSGWQPATEEYDGSSWTEVTDNPTTQFDAKGFGTQTAGVVCGGRTPPGPQTNTTTEYDGTNWTAGGNLGTARYMGAVAGTLTAGLHAGGKITNPPGAHQTVTEEYNGTSWSEVTDIPVATNEAGSAGPQTAALVFGGAASPGHLNTTLNYDGTSWSANPATLATVRASASSPGTAGSNTGAWYAGGYGTAVSALTEEFHHTFDVVTQGAWGSGGNLTTTRRSFMGGAGTLTAGMIAGGYIGPFSNATEEYDGSAWTNGGNYPASLYYVSIGGTQTAGIGVGGGDPVISEGCEYNGTAWSDITNAPASRSVMGRAGTQTAGLFAGGNNGDNSGQSEAFTYDGSSFSNITDMPDNRGGGCINGGAQTAAVMASGLGGSAPQTLVTTTDEWNGSSWGAGGTCLVGSKSSGNANSPSGSDHLTFGGAAPSRTASCFNYDGTSWFTSPALPAATEQQAGFGTPTAAVSAGGTTGSAVNTTVEFAGATTAETASTIDFD